MNGFGMTEMRVRVDRETQMIYRMKLEMLGRPKTAIASRGKQC